MPEIVMFGDGKIAETFYHYLTNDSPYKVAAFTVDRPFLTKTELFGAPVVPFEEVTALYPPSRFGMLVAVGYQELNRLRARKYREAKEKGYALVSYVSSRASNVANIRVGDNCFILENQAIQPCCSIGSDVIIWSGNHIGHHCRIEDHCFITSQVVISGGATIGPYTFIGVNATIGHEVKIGGDTIIGAGALITKNTEEKQVFIAAPTEPFRLNSDQFLRYSKL